MNRYAQIIRDTEIVTAYKNGESVKDIANAHGLSRRAIYYILQKELEDARQVLAVLKRNAQLEDGAREQADEVVKDILGEKEGRA